MGLLRRHERRNRREMSRRPLPQPPDQAPALPVPTDIRSLALTVLAVIAGIVMLRYAQAVIIPIVLGILISYALEPLVGSLERLRLPRPLAAAIVLFTVVSAGGVMLYQLRFQATEIVEQLPEGARRLRRIIEGDRRSDDTAIEKVQKAATELERAANAAAPPPAPGSAQRVQIEQAPVTRLAVSRLGIVEPVAGAMQVVLILFLAFFLLASGDLYRRKLVKIAGPSLAKKKITLQILRDIDHQIERF